MNPEETTAPENNEEGFDARRCSRTVPQFLQNIFSDMTNPQKGGDDAAPFIARLNRDKREKRDKTKRKVVWIRTAPNLTAKAAPGGN